MIGENCCIFAGSITDVKFYEGTADNGPWTMAKVKLLLVPNVEHSQVINLVAWGKSAQRLKEMENGRNIKVLSWYNPSVFNGKLQDTFEVDSFMELANE